MPAHRVLRREQRCRRAGCPGRAGAARRASSGDDTAAASRPTWCGRQVQRLGGGRVVVLGAAQRQRVCQCGVEVAGHVLHLVHRPVHAPAGTGGQVLSCQDHALRRRRDSAVWSTWLGSPARQHRSCPAPRPARARCCPTNPLPRAHLRSQTATGVPAWLVSRKWPRSGSKCGYRLRWWVAYRPTMPPGVRQSNVQSAADEACGLWKHRDAGAAVQQRRHAQPLAWSSAGGAAWGGRRTSSALGLHASHCRNFSASRARRRT